MGCLQHQSQDQKKDATLFSLLPSSQTGITFSNDLTYSEEFNPYTYRNFYNGGGVGLGDINNDGLLDIFFCGNQVNSRLYLNKGNFVFEDITEHAG
ncbi:MAG: VCBS repeat-containing protein, partial [Saprospiraceae bacterium]|nr:VCBS repeat-containing protein [Saprospiraceae bacterium]